MHYGGKYKLEFEDKFMASDWVCVLKFKGIKAEGRSFFPRHAMRRANRAMKKALKLKKQFETFKAQVCE
jgi:hypothetical protein